MWFKKNITVPVEVSARHCHLSKKDLEALFGVGYELKKARQLTQPSDFACQETVDLKVNGKNLTIRIVGSLREQTQVEISLTDAILLGAKPPIRLSGDLKNSSPMALQGPKGAIDLAEGLIVAKRHIHCATNEAARLGLKNGANVKVAVTGERPIVFEDVIVRVREDYTLCVHLDTDEGNAAGINKTGEGLLIIK